MRTALVSLLIPKPAKHHLIHGCSRNSLLDRSYRLSSVLKTNSGILADFANTVRTSLQKIAGEPVSRILSAAILRSQLGDHSSRPRLAARLQQPTRGLLAASACACAAEALACATARRAGPALPSYLALHHAGFSVPRLLPDERWALTPPFHPCLRNQHFEDVSQVSLLDATVLHSTGGLFSVALSVNGSTDFSLCYYPPGVTRRVAHAREFPWPQCD